MGEYGGGDVLENLAEARNYNHALADLVQNHLEVGPVLDFGAGSGTFAKLLRNRGLRVHCVELDRGYVAKLKAEGFDASISIDDFPYQFAFVYSLNVLEHIEDDLAALRRIRRALAEGGRFVVFVPAHPILHSSFDRRIGHFRRYSKRVLLRRLESAGFTVKKWEFFDSLGFFVALAYRIFDRGQGELSPLAVRLFDTFVFPPSRLADRVLNKIVGKNLFVVAQKA